LWELIKQIEKKQKTLKSNSLRISFNLKYICKYITKSKTQK
jgi:hypothetical protein